MMFSQRYEVIVIGAGVVGMTTALALVQAGKKVALLEKGRVGNECSWAGGGILSPLNAWQYPAAVYELAARGQDLYPPLCAQLLNHTGQDAQWRPWGLLSLQQQMNVQVEGYLLQTGLIGESIQAQDICASVLPALAQQQALWFPQVAAVRPPRLLKALAQRLTQLRCEIFEACEVKGIHLNQSKVQGLNTSAGDYVCEQAVICTGAWTRELCGQAFCAPEIYPVKGQMILLQAADSELDHIILHGDRYIIPRGQGEYVVGSTVENSAFDQSTDPAIALELKSFVTERLQGFARSEIKHHWAGLRPGTATGIPTIAEHPEVRGLFMNAGHYRNGVVMAPAAAQLLVDLVLGHQPAIDPSPYQWPVL